MNKENRGVITVLPKPESKNRYMEKYATAFMFVVWTLAGVVIAAPLENNSSVAIEHETGLPAGDSKLATAPVFEFAPLSAHQESTIPGFDDPLGAGTDPKLRVFEGEVQHMDVLGNYEVNNTEEITAEQLSSGTFYGSDLIANLLEAYLPGQSNAIFDPSLLDIDQAKRRHRFGIPVTTESSPLSLAGYGSVAEFRFPMRAHWTKCPSETKRMHVLGEVSPKIRRYFTPHPGDCYVP